MLKKSIIAAAAAAILAVGALGGTASSALAKNKGHDHHQSYKYGGKGGGSYHSGKPGYPHGGNGGAYGFHYKPKNHGYPYHPNYRWNRGWGCTPQYRMVRVWKPHHGWVRVRTYAGRTCRW